MTALAPVVGTVAALTFLAGPATVAGVPAPRAAATGDGRAAALLARAAAAADRVSYRGLQLVTRRAGGGTASLLVEVRNLPGEGTALRVREIPPGRSAEVFAPRSATAPVTVLARTHVVRLAGTGQVAGRPAEVVEARRHDGGVAGRFWLDEATGLVLRREVFDRRGALVRTSAFVQVRVGERPFVGHLPPLLPAPWADRVPVADAAGLRAAGWRCPRDLPAGLELREVRRSGEAGGEVLHASYSDGLSVVSLFEQRGRLDPERLSGYRRERLGDSDVYVRDGIQLSVVWSAGGTVYTVLADAPPDAVDAVVASLPHDPSRSGAVARLERGLRRVGSWLDPFG